MQLQSPPSVCCGFSPETDPQSTTKEQNPAQILSPHFTRHPPTSNTHTHTHDSLTSHSLACSTQARSQIPTDRGKFRVRALLLWGPHPANLPVNSRLQSCWRHMDPEERLNRRSHKEAPSMVRVRPKKEEWPVEQRIAERRPISWRWERHAHSCDDFLEVFTSQVQLKRQGKGQKCYNRKRQRCKPVQVAAGWLNVWKNHPPKHLKTPCLKTLPPTTLKLKMNALRKKVSCELTKQMKKQNTNRTQTQLKMWMENVSVRPKCV